MLWLIKRNFHDLGPEAFVLLYKHLVRAHLEYNNSVWAPYKKSDIDKLEKVQKRVTKMMHPDGPSNPKLQPASTQTPVLSFADFANNFSALTNHNRYHRADRIVNSQVTQSKTQKHRHNRK